MALMLPNTDPVTRVSIIPRGFAALGYTLQTPKEDKYLITKSEILDRIKVMLGGRAAEEIVFDEISTGAQNDLQKATEFARSMVIEYGMSERLGLISIPDTDGGPYLQKKFYGGPSVSSETGREIELEIKGILDRLYRETIGILRQNKSKLEDLAEALLEKETLEKQELNRIIAKLELTPPDIAVV